MPEEADERRRRQREYMIKGVISLSWSQLKKLL